MPSPRTGKPAPAQEIERKDAIDFTKEAKKRAEASERSKRVLNNLVNDEKVTPGSGKNPTNPTPEELGLEADELATDDLSEEREGFTPQEPSTPRGSHVLAPAQVWDHTHTHQEPTLVREYLARDHGDDYREQAQKFVEKFNARGMDYRIVDVESKTNAGKKKEA